MDQTLTVFADDGIPADETNFAQAYVIISPAAEYDYVRPHLVILLDISSEMPLAMLTAIVHCIKRVARNTDYIISIITFNEKIDVVISNTEFVSTTHIAGCNIPHGKSDFNSAIIFAMKHASEYYQTYKNTYIWVFSNGDQNVRECKYKWSDVSEAVSNIIDNMLIPIHAFSVSSAANAKKLLKLTLATGGQYEHLPTVDDVFRIISARLVVTHTESLESYYLVAEAFPGARIQDVHGGIARGYYKEKKLLIGKLCSGHRRMITFELSLRPLANDEQVNQHVLSVALICNGVEAARGNAYIMRNNTRRHEIIEPLVRSISLGWSELYFAAELAFDDRIAEAIKIIGDTLISAQEFECAEIDILCDSLRRLRIGFAQVNATKRRLDLLPRELSTREQIVLRKLSSGWPS